MKKSKKSEALSLITEIGELMGNIENAVRGDIDEKSETDADWLDSLCGRLEAMRDTLDEFAPEEEAEPTSSEEQRLDAVAMRICDLAQEKDWNAAYTINEEENDEGGTYLSASFEFTKCDEEGDEVTAVGGLPESDLFMIGDDVRSFLDCLDGEYERCDESDDYDDDQLEEIGDLFDYFDKNLRENEQN